MQMLPRDELILALFREKGNRNALNKKFDFFETISFIQTFTSVDAEEVVRCEDCKHCSFGLSSMWSSTVCRKHSDGEYNHHVKKTDYCPYGERSGEDGHQANC